MDSLLFSPKKSEMLKYAHLQIWGQIWGYGVMGRLLVAQRYEEVGFRAHFWISELLI